MNLKNKEKVDSMKKNIQTHNAKIDLVKKFLDYANIADASYAMLHYIKGVIKYEETKQEEYGDKQILGSTYNNQNSTYARAIEARFNEDKTRDWCIIPFTNKCLIEKDKMDNNNITQVKLDSKPSKRTIDFANRFRILAHQENIINGFGNIKCG